MRIRTACTTLIVAIVFCSEARGARNEEVIHYPSLLMLGPIGQSVGASYNFSQHIGSGASNTAHSLAERYSLSTVADILDPHLATLQFQGGLSYTQHFGDATSTLLDSNYNIAAMLFDLSYHPMTFTSSRTTTFISNGYQPTYSITTNTNQITVGLLNAIVPIQAFYVHATSETDGMANSLGTTSEAAGVFLQHAVGNVSTSSASLTTSGSTSGTAKEAGYAFGFRNFTVLDKAQRYRLSTAADLIDSSSNGIPQHTVTAESNLSCTFGKALSGTLADHFTYSSTVGFDNAKQSQSNNSISASLSHRLYDSLSTGLSVSASQGESLGGTTTSYSGSAALGYNKRLVAQSTMNLAVEASRIVSSQNLSGSQLSARDELHPGVNWGDRVIPALAGKLFLVIEVTNPDTGDVYTEGTDYSVDYALGFIEILTGGRIVPGSTIAISYTTLVNENIEYQTDSIRTMAGTSLLGGRYNLSASYSVDTQTLLSGAAVNQPLVSSTSFDFRASANFSPTVFGVEYSMVDSTQEKASRYSAYASHTYRTTGNSLYSFSMRDTYTTMEAVGQGQQSSSQNNLSAAASFSRRIFDFFNLSASVTASDSRSSRSYTDFVGMRSALSGAYNQLQFSLSGQLLYRVNGHANTQDRSLSCSVTRFF